MKQQEIIGKEFLSKVKNADIFSVTKDWEVVDAIVSGLSAMIFLGMEENPHYTLNIVYRKLGKKEEFTTNVATYSSFEILDSKDVAKYYMAVGNLLRHKALLADLKQTMKEYVVRMKKSEKEEED